MTSEAKAQQFAAVATANGWDAKITNGDGSDHWICDCRRGDEHINIFWIDNTLTETPKYTLAGITTSLHNKATATRQLSQKPDLQKAYRRTKRSAGGNALRAAKVGSELIGGADVSAVSGGEDSEGLGVTALKHELPFDLLESTDKEILRAIRGNRIVFLNSMTKLPEAVHVPKPMNMDLSKFNISYVGHKSARPTGQILDPDKGRAMVNFVTPNGFRSVHLDSILQIG